jgi:hypothetical protein
MRTAHTQQQFPNCVFLKHLRGQTKYEYVRGFPEKKMCHGKLLYVSLSFEAIVTTHTKNGGGGGGLHGLKTVQQWPPKC